MKSKADLDSELWWDHKNQTQLAVYFMGKASILDWG